MCFWLVRLTFLQCILALKLSVTTTASYYYREGTHLYTVWYKHPGLKSEVLASFKYPSTILMYFECPRGNCPLKKLHWFFCVSPKGMFWPKSVVCKQAVEFTQHISMLFCCHIRSCKPSQRWSWMKYLNWSLLNNNELHFIRQNDISLNVLYDSFRLHGKNHLFPSDFLGFYRDDPLQNTLLL